MKTDYHIEIRQLISKFYEPSSPPLEEGIVFARNLESIYLEVTDILPSKWIEQSDVYEALKELGFQTHLFNDELGNKTLKYFLRVRE